MLRSAAILLTIALIVGHSPAAYSQSDAQAGGQAGGQASVQSRNEQISGNVSHPRSIPCNPAKPLPGSSSGHTPLERPGPHTAESHSSCE
jgi:hypothetical protein